MNTCCIHNDLRNDLNIPSRFDNPVQASSRKCKKHPKAWASDGQLKHAMPGPGVGEGGLASLTSISCAKQSANNKTWQASLTFCAGRRHLHFHPIIARLLHGGLTVSRTPMMSHDSACSRSHGSKNSLRSSIPCNTITWLPIMPVVVERR